MKISNNPAKYEVLIIQYFRSILDIRKIWSSHGSYFVETFSPENTHEETKQARSAAEAYQKGTTRYLLNPNSVLSGQ